MPPRLNKRQQREQEELEALGTLSKPQDSSSEDEKPASKPVNAGFAALFTPGDDRPDSDDDAPTPGQKARKKKKKKAVDSATAARSQTPVAATPPRPPPPKNEKKAAKKAKARERKADKDEFDQALAELSIKYPELQTASANHSPGASSTSLASLLGVSLANLDSEAEMRKFFGSKVVQANKSGSAGPSRRSTTQRSQLTRPPLVWFQTAPREGLSLRPLTEDELYSKGTRHSWDPTPDEKWWTVEYSKKYKSVTLAFMTVVYSGDPNGFYSLLQQFPWHGDTLLQLAEVFRHREEYSQAVEYIDRALFSYERAFFGSFNFTTGLNRLDFDHIENRPFFLALHRQTTDLQRRGCVRTAFEFARLLLSLDPANDPHGALLHLDFLAVKTGMTEWLLEMFDLYAARRSSNQTKDARADPSLLPGWSYARALALRKSNDPEAGTKALVEAIRSFPSVVPLLADKLDVTLPNSIRGHPDFKIETDAKNLRAPEATLHLLSHLYAQRSAPLWKDESAWFVKTVTAEFAALPASLHATPRHQDFLSLYHNPNLRYSVYRHVMVLETTYRRLFAYIPADVLNAKTLQCDPLPPPTATTLYDNAFFDGVEDLRTFAPPRRRQRMLAQMVPNAMLREQLQAFWDAVPAVRERFPDLVQFAQAAAQMDPEELEALMLAAVIGDADGNEMPQGGGMPGGMPGDAEADEAPPEPEEDDESEEEEEEEVAPLPLRVLRNVIGRFWGRNAAPEESSSEEEEEREPVDTAGVD
ncbi:transcriptional repressor TCF25-domain-containing protein [Mycena amicta]|nr:transcriptional repressor TCF25-domain-containing protein [Mycena amicta]